MQDKCVRRKFAKRFGKRTLKVIGTILGGCVVLVFLAIAIDWLDSWKYETHAAAICGGILMIGVLAGAIASARDWCKDTWQECEWECEKEDR